MIKLTDDFYIDANDTHYILKRKSFTLSKNGKEKFRAICHYYDFSTLLENAAKAMHRDLINKTDDMRLSEAVAALKRIEARLKGLINEI